MSTRCTICGEANRDGLAQCDAFGHPFEAAWADDGDEDDDDNDDLDGDSP